jgi:hypothetical protein
VELGRIADDPAARSPLGQLGQVVRYVHQLVEDRIIREGAWSRKNRGTPQKQIQTYRRLAELLEPIYGEGLIMRMVRDNGKELENELATAADTPEDPRKTKPK